MKQRLENPFRIVFFGTPDFAVPALAHLLDLPGVCVCAVVTQPDRPAGRGNKLRISPVKELALSRGIPVLQPENIRKHQEEFLASLQSLGDVDAAVVVSFGQILPQALLDWPRAGCINIHASLLPRWRGAAPIQRAILAGDEVTGVCLMKLETGLDTGPVFSRHEVRIAPGDDAGLLHDKLSLVGAELLAHDLGRIILGELDAAPQAAAGITVAPKISNEEALIDWKEPAVSLALKIRAFSPAPGAFTYLNGRRLKVFRAVAKDALPAQLLRSPVPGAAVTLDPRSMEVYCGSGMLRLEEVQLDGKKRMSVGDFLRGAPLTAGAILGNQ